MPKAPRALYFTDENALGLGKLLLRSGRDDVLFPGHPGLPQVPLGTPDLDWMPVVAHRKVDRDHPRQAHPHPTSRVGGHAEFGIRSVWIGTKKDLGPHQQLELFLRHEDRLRREIIKRGPGPWALAMSTAGLRPLGLRIP